MSATATETVDPSPRALPGRGRLRRARPRASLRRRRARPGARPAAPGPAVPMARRRLAAPLRAAPGRPARVPARDRRTVRARPGEPAACRWALRRQVGGRVARVPCRRPGSRRTPASGTTHWVELRSRRLVARVRVLLYRTPREPGDTAPLLVVHDGPEYARYASLTRLPRLRVRGRRGSLRSRRRSSIPSTATSRTRRRRSTPPRSCASCSPSSAGTSRTGPASGWAPASEHWRCCTRTRVIPRRSTACSSSRAATSASAGTGSRRASAATAASLGSSGPCCGAKGPRARSRSC